MGKQARFVLVRPAQRRQIVQKDGVVRTGDEHLLNLLVLPLGDLSRRPRPSPRRLRKNRRRLSVARRRTNE